MFEYMDHEFFLRNTFAAVWCRLVVFFESVLFELVFLAAA